MRIPAWILVTGLALTGCGGSPEQERGSEEGAAVRALEAHMAALRSGDLKAAYDGLSWHRREQFKLADLQADYEAHKERFRHRAEGRVEKTFFDGFRVVVKVVNGDGVTEFVGLVPEGGAWRVDDAGQTLAEICSRTPASGRP